MRKAQYTYASDFFDFVDVSSGRSASRFIASLDLGFVPRDVLDVGCGRGVWLKAWKDRGVPSVVGVDGDYVDRSTLKIARDEFVAADLCEPFDLGRRFDFVQCLEVGEHIAERHADTLLANLARHGDIVMFSSATPGQGGEHHVNEQPIGYWARKFRQLGFDAFDYPRPAVAGAREIDPWYRYNTLLYATGNGRERLADSVACHLVEPAESFREYAPWGWRLRCALLRSLPAAAVHALSRLKHRVVA